MWNTYKSREEAESFLKREGFEWNQSSGQYERGEPYINKARAIVGKCLDDVWIITRA